MSVVDPSEPRALLRETGVSKAVLTVVGFLGPVFTVFVMVIAPPLLILPLVLGVLVLIATARTPRLLAWLLIPAALSAVALFALAALVVVALAGSDF